MSGPVAPSDVDTTAASESVTSDRPVVELLPGTNAQVGALGVRRVLPRRAHRTVGAWCFLDHMGPAAVTEAEGVDIGPHPHIGLQTVTWLLSGEVLHRDSLGSEQLIRPGQLNLMTAGAGIAHAEESTGRYRGMLHGAQLWVAQPEATRHGASAFEHHAELPRVELDHGTSTVLVGTFSGATSPARRDTDHVGVELDLRAGTTVVPLRPAHEHALIVLDGAVMVDGLPIEPGVLAYLGCRRDELAVLTEAPARALVIGGAPFEEPVLMWWNFVARTRDEMDAARGEWQAQGGRFGPVSSRLARIDAPVPLWRAQAG
jgi:quercetin 2,3-dioxygenase